MTDKEKREIKDGVISIFKRFNILDHTATIGGLRDYILRYINSIQEEPVSEDLEDAVNAYIGHKPDVDESSSVYGKRQAFKAGAQYQKKMFIEKACEWLQKNDSYSKPTELQVRDFRKYMEDEL